MICLEKLQKELARLTNTDLKTLPSVQEALRQRGYTQIIKGNKIIQLNQKEEILYKLDENQKEQRGIYNVTYNGKNATLIRQDLESIENAITLTKGYHDRGKNTGKGGKHIRIRHTQEKTKEGYITDLELVNLGKDLRAYLKDYKEPFIDSRGARIYE